MTKCFSVLNELREAICVRLSSSCEELRATNYVAQVIPPSRRAGFLVNLCPLRLGPFKQQLAYKINSNHSFQIEITAEITLIKFEFSKSQLQFIFPEESLLMSAQEVSYSLLNN